MILAPWEIDSGSFFNNVEIYIYIYIYIWDMCLDIDINILFEENSKSEVIDIKIDTRKKEYVSRVKS